MARSVPSDPLGAFLRAVSDDDDSAQRLRDRTLGAGKLVADRYKLLGQIARGGMASIWEAEDTKLARIVAIKFMGSTYASDPEYRARFEEEARAAARLSSPYVVQTHDHGTTDGVPYIVMERLHGEDLHARLQRIGRFPLPMLGKLASEGGRALKAAHASAIVHRDLKPKNLFLAKNEDGETVKLLDFGVAKHSGTAALMTATGVMLGSPYYMSPEQIRCERDIDVRTDLWSFAAILYRAVTGVKAFDGDLANVMFLITHSDPKPPSAICPELAPSVDAFFTRGLARKREDRYQSAGELMAAFELSMRRRTGTSGVRSIAASVVTDESPTNPYDDSVPKPMPSDHPTSAMSAPVLDRMGTESALHVEMTPAPTTGLRLGEPIAPPARPVGDRATLPNAWQAGASLNIEQEHGFSDPERITSPSPWDLDDGTAPTSLPARGEPRSSPYVVAGVAVIAAMIALTIVLALLLR